MNKIFNSLKRRKEGRFMEESKKKRMRCGGEAQGNWLPLNGSDDEPIVLPNPMVGFSLPNSMVQPVKRSFPEPAIGPPFFYYENVARTPKRTWDTIKGELYGVEPEFLDSKYICATARKRDYIHNLPIENRDHTRGLARKERYKSLGNSFQVDTVTYHLSVLRNMFPGGIKVLSLFTGIGGGEVALHRLGIHMRIVVSVEISKVNKRILRSWWNQTQTGELIQIPDVRTLTDDKIKSFIETSGGFDLVIGGSPCNNLAGRNRFHRDGLEGEHSSLFYQYPRILNTVKSVMARMLHLAI
ncbi:DNA (cytosine-5)-methyltransferase DRM1A-like [Aegilops tauschii subsp. strangulata]|uniref:DNA (cytosine-5)-methyltransferase DRM1A-like n=1 Tax=Aegilops tauschii subsp. strangulata TaxID=200361 RepID=UPI003CC8CFC5